MQLIVKIVGFGKQQNIKCENIREKPWFVLNFVHMETMTITVKSKKAKKVIESLVAKNEVLIRKTASNKIKHKIRKMHPLEIDISWVPEKQQAHAQEILLAYSEAKKSLEIHKPLKTSQDFLNEL
jgi:hypothetical protein